ncbi:MAG: hypothetical protein WAV56_03195 [Microgenomates group bacterium]
MDALITQVSIEVTVVNERVNVIITIGDLAYRQSNVPVMDFLPRFIAQDESFGLWLDKNISRELKPEEVVIIPKFPPRHEEYEYYTRIIGEFFAGVVRGYFYPPL